MKGFIQVRMNMYNKLFVLLLHADRRVIEEMSEEFSDTDGEVKVTTVINRSYEETVNTAEESNEEKPNTTERSNEERVTIVEQNDEGRRLTVKQSDVMKNLNEMYAYFRCKAEEVESN